MLWAMQRTVTETPHRRTRAPFLRSLAVLLAIVVSAGGGAVALALARGAATADTTSSEGLLLAAAWWMASALFAVLVASTVAGGIARIGGGARALRWVDVVTLPAVRRMLDRALACTIVTSAVVPLAAHAASAAPSHAMRHVVVAAAAAPGHAMRHAVHATATAPGHAMRHAVHSASAAPGHAMRHAVHAATTPPIVRGATTTAASSTTTRPAAVTVPAPAATPPSEPRPLAPCGSAGRDMHVVVRDDNLWTIAAAQLSRHGLPTDNATITRYWRRVVAREPDPAAFGRSQPHLPR